MNEHTLLEVLVSKKCCFVGQQGLRGEGEESRLPAGHLLSQAWVKACLLPVFLHLNILLKQMG